MDGVIVFWSDGVLMVQEQLTCEKQRVTTSVIHNISSDKTRFECNFFYALTHCVSVNNLSNGDVDDRFGNGD